MSMSLVVPGKVPRVRKYRIISHPDLVGGSVSNDTAAVSTTATTLTQLKSYTVTTNGVTNGMRIIVQGYVSAGTGNYEVEVNGAVPTPVKGSATGSTTSTSAVTVIDAFISLSTNSSYTVTVLADNSTSGDTTYITSVTIITGVLITSTTATELFTATVATIEDEIGCEYLSNTGAFGTGTGIVVLGNISRSTTATATLSFADQFTPSGKYSSSVGLGATDDSGTDTFYSAGGNLNYVDVVPTGYNGDVTLTVYGNVGASGDAMLLVTLFATLGPAAVPGVDALSQLFINYLGNTACVGFTIYKGKNYNAFCYYGGCVVNGFNFSTCSTTAFSEYQYSGDVPLGKSDIITAGGFFLVLELAVLT